MVLRGHIILHKTKTRVTHVINDEILQHDFVNYLRQWFEGRAHAILSSEEVVIGHSIAYKVLQHYIQNCNIF